MSSLDHAQLVMGTGVRYSLRGVADEAAGRQALAEATTWLVRVDQVFSTYRLDSSVTRLREDRAIEAVDLPLVEEVLERCSTAYVLTDGWFDPWSLREGFDPSAFVKGWSLEHVGELLEPVCSGFLVDAGGDLLVYGVPEPGRAWSVGIRHPLETAAVAAVLDVADSSSRGTAVATSGAYARGAHVIDPRTGRAAARLLSATVVGPDPGLADALATAMFVEGLDAIDRIVDLPDYAAYLVDLDRHTWATPGLALQHAS